MKVTGASGEINKLESICRMPKFGYGYLNDGKRLLKPLVKKNGKFEETTFENAFELITKKIKSTEADENAFFAGARLSNEEMYLVQKFARAAVKTNNISNFHYLNRGDGYKNISKLNVPFSQIKGAGKIYLLGSEINYENGVVGFMIHNTKTLHGTTVEVITENPLDRVQKKADKVLNVNSYYYFIKAVNFFILANGMENSIFLNDNVKGFDEYKKNLLSQDFNALLKKSGVFFEKRLIDFAVEFNNEQKAILVFAEKNITSETAKEMYNLILLTGKLGKTSSGLISLKEKNNSHGLIDMGISPDSYVSGKSIKDEAFLEQVKKVWGVNELSNNANNLFELLNNGKIKNMFVFGEDPVGCANNKDEVKELFNKVDFKVIQDYFLTETAELADVVLPASYPFECGGSFTNTQKFIVTFDKERESKLEKRTFAQLIELMNKFNVKNKFDLTHNITIEIATLLKNSVNNENGESHKLVITEEDSTEKMFNYGCDYLMKRFEEYFKRQITDAKKLIEI